MAIISKRGRDAAKPIHEPVDIELNIGDYDDDKEDSDYIFSTDDEEYEYFANRGLAPWFGRGLVLEHDIMKDQGAIQ